MLPTPDLRRWVTQLGGGGVGPTQGLDPRTCALPSAAPHCFFRSTQMKQDGFSGQVVCPNSVQQACIHTPEGLLSKALGDREGPWSLRGESLLAPRLRLRPSRRVMSGHHQTPLGLWLPFSPLCSWIQQTTAHSFGHIVH